MYVIELISQDSVHQNPHLYNSNNHSDSSLTNDKPDDYEDVLLQTSTKYWIDLWHKKYQVINIPTRHLKWIQKAQAICNMTRKFSRIFQDEMEDLINECSDLFDGKSYFVRSEYTSLKYGCHGVGPYNNIQQLVESITTSTITHNPISKCGITSLKFYLLPWININVDKEFRVFIYDRKIVAISQQHIYKSNEFLKSLEPHQRISTINKWIDIIKKSTDLLIPKITHISSYTMDVAILDDDNMYFIELNPYGKYYSAGSALFHWINDNLSEYDTIHFRYSI